MPVWARGEPGCSEILQRRGDIRLEALGAERAHVRHDRCHVVVRDHRVTAAVEEVRRHRSVSRRREPAAHILDVLGHAECLLHDDHRTLRRAVGLGVEELHRAPGAVDGNRACHVRPSDWSAISIASLANCRDRSVRLRSSGRAARGVRRRDPESDVPTRRLGHRLIRSGQEPTLPRPAADFSQLDTTAAGAAASMQDRSGIERFRDTRLPQ